MTNQIQTIYRLEELCHPDTLQLIKLYLTSNSNVSNIKLTTDINNKTISLPLFYAHLIEKQPLHEISKQIAKDYHLKPYDTFIVDQLIDEQQIIHHIYKSKPNIKTEHSIYKTNTGIYIEAGEKKWSATHSLQIFLQKQKERFSEHI